VREPDAAGGLCRPGQIREAAPGIATGGSSGGKKGATASVPEVRQLLEVVLPRCRWDPATAIAWYQAQQCRKAAATASHRARWLREHPS